MEVKLFELLIAAFITLLSSVISVLWLKTERTEKMAESNKMLLAYLSKAIDKTASLTERLTSLEALASVEIKNLSASIKRLEGAILAINQDQKNRQPK